ncbi:MAG: single-stranded DNA-binding protein [Candidatus Methanomethylicota archaeon]|uniref:Single-stranded DNA-binding protein n=1 Tax=Thermoproteota archaeon TaxID=2056631 RepID=A0A523BGR3_9CREN|nr:MAG: single-stranded DNA-binding protein [Candidatus Verstraetearchaeota archaeon]
MSEVKKIEELNPASRGVDVLVKILEVNPSREVSTRDGSSHSVAEALVGDETGCVLLSLWDDDIQRVKVGQTVSIKNGYVTLFRGSIRLNVGRYGTLELATEDIPQVNMDNNISNRSYDQQVPKFRPLYRDDYKGKFRRRR